MRPHATSSNWLSPWFIAAVAVTPLHAQTIEFTEVERLMNHEVVLSLNATPGHAYRMEWSSNALNWSGLATFPTNTSTGLTHTDAAAPYLERRFYRAVEVTGTNGVAGDHLNTADGDVIIQPRYHASFVLQWKGLMIYNDPDAPISLYNGLPRAHLILVSHEHSDHFDASVINAVKTTNTIIIAPQAVYSQSTMAPHRSQTIVLSNGGSTNVLGLNVEAVPAYNLPGGTIYHAEGNGNGYVLTIGGKRIYIAGDTADVPEMRALTTIDVAFVCMNLPYTMSVDAAANAVRGFRPRVIYPYHFSGSDVSRFKTLVGADLGIEVLPRERIALSVHRHLMGRRPRSGGVVAVGHVERRREGPPALPVHEEGDVLDMVILVASDDVEHHPSELLLHRRHRQPELMEGQQRLLR